MPLPTCIIVKFLLVLSVTNMSGLYVVVGRYNLLSKTFYTMFSHYLKFLTFSYSRLYRKILNKAYGAASGEKMLSSPSDDDNVVESECPSVASVAAPSSTNAAIESLSAALRMLQNSRSSGPLQSNVVGGEPACNDRLASLEAAVNDCASRLIAALRRDPEEISAPVETFVKQFNSLETNSALVGALTTFGKTENTGASLVVDMFSSKKKKRGRRKQVAIKVQPAAVSPRKTVLGGPSCLHTGQKVEDVCDHKLKKRKTVESCQLIPKKKPRKAPHSLSQCVTNNEGIGQNNSSKW